MERLNTSSPDISSRGRAEASLGSDARGNVGFLSQLLSIGEKGMAAEGSASF